MFCDTVAPVMTDAGQGRILNVSSSGGRSYARVSDASYGAAKAGVLGLTRQLAHQLGPHGITVNAIAPGTTLASPRVSERIEALPHDVRTRILESIPLRRFATTQDIVGPMEFLCVGDSDYITGAVLDVNGGFYMA
jgi:3-oxoacyl-[acyl-carrier protein] reductase